MKKEEQFLLWFEQLERKDVDLVGGKSSSLGEMTAKTRCSRSLRFCYYGLRL